MRIRFRSIGAAAVLLAASVVFGQAPASPAAPAASAKLTFDVATVKPSVIDMGKMQAAMQSGKMPKFGPEVDHGRAEYNLMSLKDLIALAFKVKAYQISGPDWLATERFDILAKMPDGATKDDAPAMLQALLEDRFKLAVRRETEEHPVMALVVGKGGPKLKESLTAAVPLDEDTPLKPGEMKLNLPDGPAHVMVNSDGSSTTNMGIRGTYVQKLDMEAQTVHLNATNLTMDGLVDLLNQVMLAGGGANRQVVDMTGLKGSYDVVLDISIADMMANARAQGMNIPGAPAGGGGAGEASDPGGGGATITSAVQSLGLKLESRKAPVEQLVVDHAEKTPTEN